MDSHLAGAAAKSHDLAVAAHCNGEPVRPERLYLRALRLKERLYGADHPEVATTLNNLGLFYKGRGRLAEASDLYSRALRIFERHAGPSTEETASVLENLALTWKAMADEALARAASIEQSLRDTSDPDQLAQRRIDPSAARFRLEIQPSRIHRFGVFASEPIPASVEIIEYTGERLNRREVLRRVTPGSTYLCAVNSYWSIDGSKGGSGAEFINHRCEPNVRFRRHDGRVFVDSLRAIARGEELALDYNFDKRAPRVECHCGAEACRGTINALRYRRPDFY